MDQKKVQEMREHYVHLNDEELASIVATRWESLTEEARFAMSAVTQARGIEAFKAEVKATNADLKRQADQVERGLEKHEIALRQSYRLLLITAAIMIIVGAVVAVYYDIAPGVALISIGVALPVIRAIRKFVFRLIHALFRMD